METDVMRELKNWTVVGKSIKRGRDGFLSYYHYLNSKGGKHKYQTITNLTGKRSAFNMVRIADTFNLAKRLKTGGRESAPAYSIMSSYPFEMDDKIMMRVFKINMMKFYRYVSDENSLGLNDKDIKYLIKNETVAVVHRGFKTNKKPINNHIHLLVQKHFKPSQTSELNKALVSIDLTKKKYMRAFKLFNNQTITDILGINLFDYEIQTKETHKKRISDYSYQQKTEIQKQTVKEVDKVTELLNEVMKHIEDYKQWANANQTHNEDIPKHLSTALKQLKNGNTKRARQSLKNFQKSHSLTPNH